MFQALPWIPVLIACVLSLTALPAIGQSVAPNHARTLPQTNPMAAIRADRWDQAAAIAAGLPDPVAAKLVTYYRLLSPAGGTLREITAFVAANPDWPGLTLLDRRRQENLAVEADDIRVLAECDRSPVTSSGAWVRCADAMRSAGRTAEATDAARRAWIAGFASPEDEAPFLTEWNGALRPRDELARFDQLAWSNSAGASRQIIRLDAQAQQAAQARLALRRDDPGASDLLAALPEAARIDPGIMLEQARKLRRAGQYAPALALWLATGRAAQDALAGFPARLTEFWNERQRLARQLLRDGNAQGAYDLVCAQGQKGVEAETEAEFLAGFIALRRLNQPEAAARHFETLIRLSRAVISQGRGQYWLGRAQAAAGQDPKRAYEMAAGFPTSFYGQLAAIALGDGPAAIALRINALRDPKWTDAQMRELGGKELAHAAILLTGWDERGRAHAFVLRLDELAPDPPSRSLIARFATALGLPEMAVFVARRMGRDGIALPEAGWPSPVMPPAEPVDPSVTLGLIRQESSFETTVVSGAGARGLMQLMPGTAELMGKRLGQPIPRAGNWVVTLTTDAALNMRLGTAYLRAMLDRFGGSLPLAIAAYNAGPNRVDFWLAENGDPRAATEGIEPVNMLDWIEEIPFAETRNYVQRVLENVGIYRARQGDNTSTLEPRWNR